MIFTIEKDLLIITIENNLYSEDVIFKCFYWYTGMFSVDIVTDDDKFVVSMEQKVVNSDIHWNDIIEKIKQDLIDYKLRSIVRKETNTIRELIVAKAFAYYQETEPPNTDVSDPVGFNPEDIQLYE